MKKGQHEAEIEILLSTQEGNQVKIGVLVNAQEIVFMANHKNKLALEVLTQIHEELRNKKVPHEFLHCTRGVDHGRRDLVESLIFSRLTK